MPTLRYRAVLFDLDGIEKGARCWVLGAGCCTQHSALSTQHSILRKPDPQHVLRRLEETNCRPADALFVGDMPVDVEAARNSGIDVAVLTTGSSTYNQLLEAHPDHMLSRFSDLLEVVRNGAAA